MLRKKFIIPMVAIMSVASSGSVFASEKSNNENDTTVIYKNAEVTAKSGLNVRETPAIEADNKLFAVPVGTELGIVEKQNDWYKVKVNNSKEAYINSNYVKINNNDLYVNVDRLNFREGPGMDKKIHNVLTKGTKVEFLEENGNWIKVKVDNTTGYVHSKYVVNEKPVVKNESTSTSNKSETTVETTKKPESNASNVKPSQNEDTTNKKDEQTNKTEDKKEETNKTESEKNTESTNKVDKEESTSTQSESNKDKTETSKPQTSKPETSKPQPSKPETSKPESSKPSDNSESNESSQSKNVQAVIDLAYAQIGKPYNWGAVGPNSFDCSGLMKYIFDNGGDVNLPRTSKAQSQYGTTVSRSNLKPGDLVFSSTDGSGTVSHVGIYVGGGKMIHAPKPGDVVKISSINTSYWNDAYLWAKRVM